MMFKLVTVLLAGCVLSLPVHSDEALWSMLKTGGQVVLMRHAVTTPGVGDPDGMVLSDCNTQRNLTDGGHAHARRIGEAFRTRGISVTQVFSSPWCRCLDTARLAFGLTPEATPALSNLFGQVASNRQQIEGLRALVSRKPASGNTVLVSHGSTIQAVTGISPETGEMVVIMPLGGGRFTVAGRLEVPAR